MNKIMDSRPTLKTLKALQIFHFGNPDNTDIHVYNTKTSSWFKFKKRIWPKRIATIRVSETLAIIEYNVEKYVEFEIGTRPVASPKAQKGSGGSKKSFLYGKI